MRSCAVAVTPERVPSNLCSVEWSEPAHHGNHNQKVHPTCFSWKISFYKRSKVLSPTVSNSCPQLYKIPVPNCTKFLSPTVSNSCPQLYQIPVPNSIKFLSPTLSNSCPQLYQILVPNCIKFLSPTVSKENLTCYLTVSEVGFLLTPTVSRLNISTALIVYRIKA